MKAEELKRNIIKIVRYDKFCGYEAHKKLASEGIKVNIGRLYKILNEMLKDRSLESNWEKSHRGPRKRVYWLSETGKNELDSVLLENIKIIHGFYSEYLLSLSPRTSPFDRICRSIAHQLERQSNIAYITSKCSMMDEKMVCTLHSNLPQGTVYLVKPESVSANFQVDNVLSLDGTHLNIPLRDGYVDLLMVIDMPRNEFVDTALKEWLRVLKQRGTLAILTPSVLVNKPKDPMTIGDFIEQHEHKPPGKGEQVGTRFLQARLGQSFRKVDRKQIVHITVFLASEQLFPIANSSH